MQTGKQDYGLFLRFFDHFAPVGFQGIDPADPLVVEMEDMMEKNDQFFYIGDLLKMEILYVSKRSAQMMGIKQEDLRPNHFLEASHPDDLERASLGRVRLFKMAHKIILEKEGFSLLSSNYRMRNGQGKYSDFLSQFYVFYSKLPYESAFIIKVQTNIDRSWNIKRGYHFYTGEDFSYFRFPDTELLMTGIPYSNREFEIINLIASGLNTEQVAEKLFLSRETVSTHRRNILKKSGKKLMSDVIYDLVERGVMG